MKLFKKYIELIFLSLIIFSGIFLSKYPTLHNAINTPPESFFTKQASWFDAWDINAYVSHIIYSQKNGLLLKNSYTTFPHSGSFVYQTYTFLGIFNRYLKLDPFLLFHLSAIFIGIILILGIYVILRTYFIDIFQRQLGLLIIVLGGGFGWLNQQSADYSIAGFNIVDPLERPHNALSTLFIILSVSLFAKFLKIGRLNHFIYSLIFAFATFTIHPPFAIYFLILYFIGLFFLSKNINRNSGFLMLAILGIFYIIYYFFILKSFMNNPGFQGIINQNIWRPQLSSIILGFGALIIGIVNSFLNNDKKIEVNLIKIAFILHLILAFIPFGFHMYYFKGLYIWAVILAIHGSTFIFKKQFLVYWLILLVIMSLPFRIKIFRYLTSNNYNNQFFYLLKSEGNALNYLSANIHNSNVLSLFRIGDFIPAFSDNRVYFGHSGITPSFNNKLLNVEKFYLTEDNAYQLAFLKSNSIHYVYVGLEEQLLRQKNKLPPFVPFEGLEKIYKDAYIEIYKVI